MMTLRMVEFAKRILAMGVGKRPKKADFRGSEEGKDL